MSKAVPLFSPTQTSGRETVSHSIFSPKFPLGITSLTSKNKHNLRRGMIPMGSVYQMESRGSQTCDGDDFGDESRDGVGPLVSPAATRASRLTSPSSRKTITTPGTDGFHTPLTSLDSPLSTNVSTLSNVSGSTFHSLPVGMLSFDYVKNCNSAEKLTKIVSALETEYPQRYPSLLRTAKKQLRDVETESPVGAFAISMEVREPLDIIDTAASPIVPSRSTGSWQHEPYATNHSFVSWSNKDDSSLIMSISSSCLHDELDAVGYQPSHQTKAPPKDSPNEQAIPSSNALKEEVATLIKERDATEQALTARMQELQSLADETRGTKTVEHLVFLERLVELQRASSISANKETTVDGNLQSECQVLKQSLENRMADQERRLAAAHGKELDLKDKVNKLTQELRSSEAAVENVKLATRKEVQHQTSAELSRLRQSKESLRKTLSDAQSSMRALRREHRSTIATLQGALGRDVGAITSFDDKQRRELVADVVRKLASSKAAVKALANAVAASEQDRVALQEERFRARKEISDLKALNAKLQQENEALVRKNSNLLSDLQGGSVYGDKALVGGQGKDGWREKEQEYLKTIATLRTQIIGEDAKVSLALYKKAVTESRQKAHAMKEKQRQITTLQSEVKTLRASVLGRQDARSALTRTKPQVGVRPSRPVTVRRTVGQDSLAVSTNAIPNIRLSSETTGTVPTRKTHVQPFGNLTNKMASTSNSRAKEPLLVKTNASSGRSPTQRIIAIRAAGGRAGLSAKLKSVRQSPTILSPR